MSAQCPDDYSLIASKQLLQPPRLPDPGIWCVAAAALMSPTKDVPAEERLAERSNWPGRAFHVPAARVGDKVHTDKQFASAADSIDSESSQHEHMLRAGELLVLSMHFKSDTGGALRVDILEYMAEQFNSQ